MNKLFIIVGASGVGKTTLMHALLKEHPFRSAPEQHEQRPFQTLFKQDKQYALSNQLDYLLLRAEQEQDIRSHGDLPALMDGGLDLDYHGFTRLFHARGWLSTSEFELCKRFHKLIRKLLPPPDLVIHLRANTETIHQRLASRNRINIASAEDADLLETLIMEWLDTLPQETIVRSDVSQEGINYPISVPLILDKIRGM